MCENEKRLFVVLICDNLYISMCFGFAAVHPPPSASHPIRGHSTRNQHGGQTYVCGTHKPSFKHAGSEHVMEKQQHVLGSSDSLPRYYHISILCLTHYCQLTFKALTIRSLSLLVLFLLFYRSIRPSFLLAIYFVLISNVYETILINLLITNSFLNYSYDFFPTTITVSFSRRLHFAYLLLFSKLEVTSHM